MNQEPYNDNFDVIPEELREETVTSLMTISSLFLVIPAVVASDEKLSPIAKIIYGEIVGLTRYKGNKVIPCFASNNHFEKLLNTPKREVQRGIAQLKERGYIEVKYEDEKAKHLRKITPLITVRKNFTS